MSTFLRAMTGLVVLGLAVIPARSQIGERIYLDLPNASGRGETSEENLPEIIQFYGQEYEGDGVFFSLDNSSSMQFGRVNGRMKLDIEKAEVVKALQDMNHRMEFGLVWYNWAVHKYNDSPVIADEGQITSAIQWVMAITPTDRNNGTTCIGGGTREALNIAHRSQKPHRTVILTGDGDPSRCAGTGRHSRQQAKQWIRQANTQNLPINTIYVGEPGHADGKNFMRQVAMEHGGTYTEAAG